jgi:hypothetical protein
LLVNLVYTHGLLCSMPQLRSGGRQLRAAAAKALARGFAETKVNSGDKKLPQTAPKRKRQVPLRGKEDNCKDQVEKIEVGRKLHCKAVVAEDTDPVQETSTDEEPSEASKQESDPVGKQDPSERSRSSQDLSGGASSDPDKEVEASEEMEEESEKKSGDKAAAGEEEGNTAPLPERVRSFHALSLHIGWLRKLSYFSTVCSLAVLLNVFLAMPVQFWQPYS